MISCPRYPLLSLTEAVVQMCSVKQLFLEISQNSQGPCNFIKKETVAQVFSREFYKISKNTFSYRTPPVAASALTQHICHLCGTNASMTAVFHARTLDRFIEVNNTPGERNLIERISAPIFFEAIFFSNGEFARVTIQFNFFKSRPIHFHINSTRVSK